MSIDKQTMKIFFEAMQGTVLGNAGYSSRIVPTPMGPFKWNETLELWENVNNGMVMSNISLNDLMMIGYDNMGGGPETQEEQFVTGNLGILSEGVNALTESSTDYWAAIGGAVKNSASASVLTFIKAISIQFERTDLNVGPTNMFYIKNAGSKTTYSTTISMNVGDTLKVGITTPLTGDGQGKGSIRIFDVATNKTISTVPYFFEV